MKYIGLMLFIILLPTCLAIMFVPSVAYYAQYFFFGLCILINEGLESEFLILTQVIAASIIPSLPILLWVSFRLNYGMGTIDKFFGSKVGSILLILLVLGSLVGVYFYINSSSVLGAIERYTYNWKNDTFGSLYNLNMNFARIYGWYAYPFVQIILVSLLFSYVKLHNWNMIAFLFLFIIAHAIFINIFTIVITLVGLFMMIGFVALLFLCFLRREQIIEIYIQIE